MPREDGEGNTLFFFLLPDLLLMLLFCQIQPESDQQGSLEATVGRGRLLRHRAGPRRIEVGSGGGGAEGK